MVEADPDQAPLRRRLAQAGGERHRPPRHFPHRDRAHVPFAVHQLAKERIRLFPEAVAEKRRQRGHARFARNAKIDPMLPK